MSGSHSRIAVVHGTLAVSMLLGFALAPPAFGAGRDPIELGEINANDVYVRSGPSRNHYTTCKLQAGEAVRIMARRGEWVEILPPAEAFSLISSEYVDTPDKKSGVVNGHNVRVRAGSVLNDSKYTVQLTLSKGADVSILGENPDGFYRIKPPAGATLWVHADFVAQVPETLAGSAAPADPAPANPVKNEADPASETAEESPERAPAQESESKAPESTEPAPRVMTPLSALPATALRDELNVIDAAMRVEVAKPMFDRQLDPLAQRYRSISEQPDDGFASRYAQRRLEQVDDMITLEQAIRKLRNLDDKAQSVRRDFLTKRADLHQVFTPAPTGVDAQGELRVSAVYTGGVTPKRFRLVDPSTPGRGTIAYVEIPSDATFNADEFIGRYVGVRASGAHLLTGGVAPVPVYIASELIAMEAPSTQRLPEE